MNIVVESRKRFGKMCVDYEQKTSLMENKMLNLQLETISNYRFKPKHVIPEQVEDMCKDTEDITLEILERQQRIEDVRKRLKSTQDVVQQLKADIIGKKARGPLTAEAMLMQAKAKKL